MSTDEQDIIRDVGRIFGQRDSECLEDVAERVKRERDTAFDLLKDMGIDLRKDWSRHVKRT